MTEELVSLIEIPKDTALTVFTTPKGTEVFIQKIKDEVAGFVPDLSTKKSRQEIASLAMKIAKSKTYLESLGKELCDQERAKIDITLDAIMTERKRIKEQLDQLRDEVRKQLTEWEEAEDARLNAIKFRIEKMETLPEPGSSVDALQKHLSRLEKTEIDESFGELTADAAIARTKAIRECKARLDTQMQLESDQKELAELKLKQAAQAQIDREQRIAKEAEEKGKREAEEASKREVEKAQAQAFAAQERARLDKEAEQRAKNEKEIAEEKRRNNEKHREKVISEAVNCFIGCGLEDAEALRVVKYIETGLIKNITINF